MHQNGGFDKELKATSNGNTEEITEGNSKKRNIYYSKEVNDNVYPTDGMELLSPYLKIKSILIEDNIVKYKINDNTFYENQLVSVNKINSILNINKNLLFQKISKIESASSSPEPKGGIVNSSSQTSLNQYPIDVENSIKNKLKNLISG